MNHRCGLIPQSGFCAEIITVAVLIDISNFYFVFVVKTNLRLWSDLT